MKTQTLTEVQHILEFMTGKDVHVLLSQELRQELNLREYPAFFRNALSSNDPNGLKEYIYRESFRMYHELLSAEGFDMKSPYNELLLTGYIRGALEVTCEWAASGMDLPLEMLFEISYELIPHQIQRCLATHYM